MMDLGEFRAATAGLPDRLLLVFELQVPGGVARLDVACVAERKDGGPLGLDGVGVVMVADLADIAGSEQAMDALRRLEAYAWGCC